MDILHQHRAMRERVQSIQAEARVDQRGDQGRIKGTVLMFVARPGRVRFDVMTQFGPAAILTSDGAQFAFSDLREKRYLHGATCPRNIARLLGIPMSVQDTTVLLLGGSSMIEHTEAEMEWVDGYYRVRLRAADGRRQVVDLALADADMAAPPDKQRLRLVRSEIFDAQGRSTWRTRYDDYRVLPMGDYGIAMPFEVRVEQPSTGTDTLIKFQEIQFDPEVATEAFTQQPRPGMTQEEALCD